MLRIANDKDHQLATLLYPNGPARVDMTIKVDTDRLKIRLYSLSVGEVPRIEIAESDDLEELISYALQNGWQIEGPQ